MSLRDAVEAAVNTVEETQKPEAAVETPAPESPTPAPVEAKEAPKVDDPRVAGRERDEKGRLLPGKAEKKEAAPPPKAAPAAAAAPAPEPEKPKFQRPSSWKRERWGDWDKIAAENPELAQYLHQREGEFAQGVSTYKQDFERVKPLQDAISPYEPFLRQINMQPAEFVQRLAGADQTLRYGSEEQKLRLLASMIQDYRLPVHQLLVKGEDGGVYFNQQYFQQQQNPAQPQGLTPQDVQKVVEQKLTEQFWQQEIKRMKEAKDEGGNPRYPDFERLRKDMHGLLQSGVAQGLEDAYAKAERLHDDIWEGKQAAKQAAAAKAAQEAQARQVAKAKATAVSAKTATPAPEAPTKAKGLRDTVAKAVDAHTGSARV